MVNKSSTSWEELSGAQAGRGGEYTKEALKNLIETRRHNDMVRKREFEYLRKIRIQGGNETSGAESHPSVLQTNIPQEPLEPDDRAQTLKKIDAIEAEMSRMWWRKKALEAAPETPKTAPTSLHGNTTVNGSASTLAFDQRTVQAPYEPTEATPLFQKTEILMPPKSVAPRDALRNDLRIHAAARAYASGDEMGAELNLLLVVGEGQRDTSVEVWLTLLDLYRVTGQAEVFDARSLEFVNLFGRSAPSWQNWANGSPPSRTLPVWTCPAYPQAMDFAPLQGLIHAGTALTLDWARLEAFELDTAHLLELLCVTWAEIDVQLEWRGVARLLSFLQAKTPLEQTDVDKEWWALRLAVLRLLGLMHDFDSVALDFCVTYELSPPTCDPVRCRCVVLGDGGVEGVSSGVDRGSPHQLVAVYVLSGAITGDARPWLLDWAAPEMGPLPWEINCHDLLRMDVSAAADFVDWLRLQHEAGFRVHLVEVNRLVAALWLSMEADQWAKLILRND